MMVMTDYKLPVVYSYMPIKCEEEVLAYVCAKCYLLEEKNTYDIDGSVKSEGKIVFVYNVDGKLNEVVIKDGKCTNASNAQKIFRTLNSCKNFVRFANEELFYKKCSKLKTVEEEVYYYNNKNNIINRYQELENILLYGENNIVNINDYKMRRRV